MVKKRKPRKNIESQNWINKSRYKSLNEAANDSLDA